LTSSPRSGPQTTLPSSRIETAISTRSSSGRRSQLLIDRSQSSIELAEKAPLAVTPCGSRRQPIALTQSPTFAAIPCM
jgi:hypothetical protein